MAEIQAGPEAIAHGIDRLTQGQLVAFPTETVYGLGANALDQNAVNRVFELKGRPSNNPLIVHVSGIEMAQSVVSQWNEQALKLAKAFWPGPLTLVLKKSKTIPPIVSAGGDTVAVRCPHHPLALALIEAFEKPIVGPSANPSGRISPTTPEHVVDGFKSHDLLVLEGGHCRAGIESTVVDLTSDPVRVLRPGVIGVHAIEQVLNQSVECVSRNESDHESGNAPRSPGMIGAHYQPCTPTISYRALDGIQIDHSSVLISWSSDHHPHDGTLISIPKDIGGYAQNLYRTLHHADGHNASKICIELPPIAQGEDDRAIEHAILERIARATHVDD